MAGKVRPAVVIPGDAPPVAWGAVAQSLVLMSAEVARVPGAAEALKVMKALAGVGDAQAMMLQQIGSDVALIRTGPFYAAREHLDIAMRKAGAGAEYKRHLQEAEDLLVQALAQCKTVEEQSVVKFNLGVVAAARGDRAESCFRLRQAYVDAAVVTRELSARAANVRVVKGPGIVRGAAIAGMVLYYPVGAVVAARKFAKLRKSHQATAALQAYVPFANTVARAHNVIEPAAILPAPQLSGEPGKGFQLEWAELRR